MKLRVLKEVINYEWESKEDVVIELKGNIVGEEVLEDVVYDTYEMQFGMGHSFTMRRVVKKIYFSTKEGVIEVYHTQARNNISGKLKWEEYRIYE